MEAEVVTKKDLEQLRLQLLVDLRELLKVPQEREQQNEWLKSGELRKLISASPGTLQNLRIQGKLHPVKIGGTWYYNRKEIESLFKG